MEATLGASETNHDLGISERLFKFVATRASVTQCYMTEMNVGTFYELKWLGPEWAEKWLPWVFA